MDKNNLVKEIYPEQVKSINPYDISYIAMKNGSIIMIIEPIFTKNIKNNYYEKNEQNSPNFNIQGKKFKSRIKGIKEINNNMKINIDNDENNNNLNYSFRSSDGIIDKITYDKNKKDNNNYYIEKRKYIFYQKSNNENIENNNNNIYKHSKTFSYKTKFPENNLNNSSIKNYNNISIRNSKYSSKKNKNIIKDSNCSCTYIKSNSENINNISNNIIYNNKYKNPKIEYIDDFTINKYLNNNIKRFRAKTPEINMKYLGKKNNKRNKNNELKRYLSKDNIRYYERIELGLSKQNRSNYIKLKSNKGNTLHVFESK